MKRLFLTAIIVLSAVSLSAVQRPDSVRQASAAEPNIAYGWNFEFFGGAGVGQYMYDQLFTNYTTPHVTNKLAYPTWTAGLGINYYFIPAMGIGTGAQISTYTNNAAINKPWTVNALDAYNDTYIMTARPMGLTESQEIYMVEVPLALKFRARPGVVGFTGTLGAKIGLPIKNSYKLSSNGVINNSVYYEKFDLTIHDVPGVVESKNIPSVAGSLPKSAFQMLSYAAYVELGMLIRLHQRVELAITAYGNYYFTDLMSSHPATALGFATTGTVGEYPEPYTEKYTNVLQTNEVKTLHPWTAGIKIGIQINANRTKAERDFDREQKRLRKEAKEREKALLDSLAEVARLEAEAAAIAAAEAAALAALIVPVDTIPVVDTIPADTIPTDTIPAVDPREEAIEEIRRIAAEHHIDICETFCPQAVVVPVIVHDTLYIGTETVVPVISKEDTVAQLLDEELKRAVIYFELDKSVPILEPKDILIRIAEVLKRHPEKKIHVNGHACKLGRPEHNQRLSLRRAKAVAAKLRELGVKEDQMIIAHMGSDIPYRYNGRHQLAKDRRVEIIPTYRTTEVVRPGSRLAQIARRHYGNPDYWIYIYEANKDQIINPSALPTGIELIIPDLSDILNREKMK